MSDHLDVAKEAALEAGKVLKEYFNKDYKYEKKGDNTYVSEADLAAEKLILKRIKEKFPSHAFYSEEAGSSDNESEFCWYIDPLDGTHNFMHKIPLFAVSIGLTKNNEFILGVIYIPMLDELYYAEKGNGAYMNGEKISVANRPLNKSCVAISSYFQMKGDSVLKMIDTFRDRCFSIKLFGSGCVCLAYVAKGVFDFYVKPTTTTYDDAAGIVLIREAGGMVSELDKSDYTVDSDDLLVSSSILYDEVSEILKKEGLTCKQ